MLIHRIKCVNTAIAPDIPPRYRPSATPLPNSPLFTVGESKRSGVILCKSHCAEFAGPGAAISTPAEQGYTAVLAIGCPELVLVTAHSERQKAYGRRIQWLRWLNKIVSHPEPAQRVEKLLAGFEEFFGNEIVAAIPSEVISSLAGVLPQTVSQLSPSSPVHSLEGGIPSLMPKADCAIKLLDLKQFQPPNQSILPIYPAFAEPTLPEPAIALPYSA
jgi:hypothetical protein